jgi:protein-disulfide isomerase
MKDAIAAAGRMRSGLELVATLLAIVVCCLAIERHFSASQPAARAENARPKAENPPLPVAPISVIGTNQQGGTAATVAMIEFADFQCPYCRTFAQQVLPALEAKYVQTGKVRLAFRFLPLEKIHGTALIAADAAECAGRQGRFWEMHNWLFDHQRETARDTLRVEAGQLRLDTDQFDACVAEGGTDQVRSDEQDARAMGIDGTPTFLIGRLAPDGRVTVTDRLSGVQSEAAFSRAIDAALAQTAGSKH